MSETFIPIEVNHNQINKDDKLQLHFLPAKVHGDGTANVENYFNNYTRRSEGDILTNSLRGYPLQGIELDVPDQIKALVLQESNNSNARTLRISGTFDKFTYWNYDKIPSKADAYIQALNWFELSAELAKPVSEVEILAEIESSKKQDDSKENKSI